MIQLSPVLVYEMSLDVLLLLLGDSFPGKEKEWQDFTERDMEEKYLEVFQILKLFFICSCYVLQKSLVVRPLSLTMK